MSMIAPQGLEKGEKLLWKYDETHYVVFFPWSIMIFKKAKKKLLNIKKFESAAKIWSQWTDKLLNLQETSSFDIQANI